MQKKLVSKFTFNLCHFSFQFICLCGVIWQITQVSINFFKFDVLKDINVVMPEDISPTAKWLYICFENPDLLDDGKYSKRFMELSEKYLPRYMRYQGYLYRVNIVLLLSRRMSVAERFSVSPTRDQIYGFPKATNYSKEFIIGPKYCIVDQVSKYKFENPSIRKSWLKNVSSMEISIDGPLYNFASRRLREIHSFGSLNESTEITVKSYEYVYGRKEWPYSDDCKDYSKLDGSIKWRREAIIRCENELAKIKGQYSFDTIVLAEGAAMSNYSASNWNGNCSEMHKQLDCAQNVYVTMTDPPSGLVHKPPTLVFKTEQESVTSFFIVSKAKIDNIDYVVYIFGSLGSWLGFTFIALNPVPFILAVQSNAATESDQNSTETDENQTVPTRTILSRQINECKKREERWKELSMTMQSRIHQIESDHKRDVLELRKQIQDISDKIE